MILCLKVSCVQFGFSTAFVSYYHQYGSFVLVICIGVNSSSRGSVDIGSVDLFQEHYCTFSFSPAPGSEECLLFFMTMTIA